ncbi:LOW QUALITY PROTEIN: hypothetical protein HID58_080850 [Brassica napus]|uniref:Aminopeptidase P N-terminal domain-containing protein n=1 Tax=Brassica napus TaxID=3708 RepID=A0ABQ7Y7D3_BRANA|nr:LOW QUALITY PROTEIN: hypothetical protein HID58_080850 [Brassica napus]
MHDIAWQGEVAGVDAASRVFKAEQAYPIKQITRDLSDMIRSSSKVFHNDHQRPHKNTQTWMSLKTSLGKVKSLSSFTHELRLIKSPAELKLMRESASIACQGLLKTMLHSKGYPDEGIW